MAVLEWSLFVLGLLIVAGTSVSVVKTLIVPRRAWSLIPRAVETAVTWVFMTIARRMRSFDLIDRFLGFLGPAVLLTTLLAWLAFFVIGFALMLTPSATDVFHALGQSGASTFTLGITTTIAGSGTAVSVAASATGLIVIALTIAYLPSLYAVIRRRETLARQLGVRAGTPAWGPNVLLAHHRADALDVLLGLFNDWDHWANDVADGHIKYPVLNQFRLPRGKHHWLVSLLAVLDAAGIDQALRPESSPPEARLLLVAGAACADDLTASLRLPPIEDPGVLVDHDEFAAAVGVLADEGYPIEQPTEQAWKLFVEWRVEYAATVSRLLDVIVAPAAPWSGTRTVP